MTRSRILTSRFRETALVTLKDGTIFKGVLYSCDKIALVLRAAEAVGAGENRTNLPVDGEILVLMADVAYIQVP